MKKVGSEKKAKNAKISVFPHVLLDEMRKFQWKSNDVPSQHLIFLIPMPFVSDTFWCRYILKPDTFRYPIPFDADTNRWRFLQMPISFDADNFWCRYLLMPITFDADSFCADTLCRDTFCTRIKKIVFLFSLRRHKLKDKARKQSFQHDLSDTFVECSKSALGTELPDGVRQRHVGLASLGLGHHPGSYIIFNHCRRRAEFFLWMIVCNKLFTNSDS